MNRTGSAVDDDGTYYMRFMQSSTIRTNKKKGYLYKWWGDVVWNKSTDPCGYGYTVNTQCCYTVENGDSANTPWNIRCIGPMLNLSNSKLSNSDIYGTSLWGHKILSKGYCSHYNVEINAGTPIEFKIRSFWTDKKDSTE